jgi:transcriptional regulator GlxA family with amidase domain
LTGQRGEAVAPSQSPNPTVSRARALAYAKRNLASPLTVKQLANAAHLSPRQFSRAFRAETGQSPAKAVENLRVETARLMMEQSRHSIDVIARQTGFADRYRAGPSCAPLDSRHR